MKIQETGDLRSRFAKLKTEEVIIKKTALPSSDDIDRAYRIDSGEEIPGAFGRSVTERVMNNDEVDSLRYLLDAFTEIHSLIETD